MDETWAVLRDFLTSEAFDFSVQFFPGETSMIELCGFSLTRAFLKFLW